MFQYQNLIFEILRDGEDRNDRTGVGTRALFNRNITFKMEGKRFPLVTLKKTLYKAAFGELAAFIRGSSDNSVLQGFGCNYWKENLNAPYWVNSPHKKHKNDLGRLGYSTQLRDFNGVDQLRTIMSTAKHNPTDRRMLAIQYNPSEIDKAVLPACHYAWQLFVHGPEMEYVSLLWNQRSADVMLGLPMDFAYYGALLAAIANELGKEPYELSVNIGDAHIYLNHYDNALKLALDGKLFEPPTYEWVGKKGAFVEEFQPDDIEILGYESGPYIQLEMAV